MKIKLCQLDELEIHDAFEIVDKYIIFLFRKIEKLAIEKQSLKNQNRGCRKRKALQLKIDICFQKCNHYIDYFYVRHSTIKLKGRDKYYSYKKKKALTTFKSIVS